MPQTASIEWSHDFDSALARARREAKPLLMDFSAAPL